MGGAKLAAPDGSILLCLITDAYTRPRDQTAVGISIALGLVAATGLYSATSRFGTSRLRWHS